MTTCFVIHCTSLILFSRYDPYLKNSNRDVATVDGKPRGLEHRCRHSLESGMANCKGTGDLGRSRPRAEPRYEVWGRSPQEAKTHLQSDVKLWPISYISAFQSFTFSLLCYHTLYEEISASPLS